MRLFYFIWGAFLRLWFGSDDLKPKILQNRGIQTFFMLSTFIFIFKPDDLHNWVGWVRSLVISCWLQFQYFSRGHGPAIDTGYDKNPSEDTKRRYDERWYHWVCDKLLSNHKYGFAYDCLWLLLRYGCPMLITAILAWNHLYIYLGIIVPFIYVFSNTLQREEPWIFDPNKWYWRRGWSLAEILLGGTTYLGCYVLENIYRC